MSLRSSWKAAKLETYAVGATERIGELENLLAEAEQKIAAGKEHSDELLRDLDAIKTRARKTRARVKTGDRPYGARQLPGAEATVLGQLMSAIKTEANGNAVRASELRDGVAKKLSTPVEDRRGQQEIEHVILSLQNFVKIASDNPTPSMNHSLGILAVACAGEYRQNAAVQRVLGIPIKRISAGKKKRMFLETKAREIQKQN